MSFPTSSHAPLRRKVLSLLTLGLACLGVGNGRAETLTLAQCLRETAEHNPQIIQQRLAIEQAAGARLTLRARALPTFTVGGIAGELEQETVGTRTTTKNPVTMKRVTTVTATTDKTELIVEGVEFLYQPLFDAAIPASYRRGTDALLAAEQNYYAVASTILHTVRLLFLRNLYQQQLGALYKETDAILASNVQNQNQLTAAGLAGRAALLSAEVRRTNFNPDLLASTGAYRTNLAALLQTMGRDLSSRGADPLAGITLAGTLGEARPTFEAASATERALARRPDLRALRELVRTNQEDANIARGGYYPLVRLYLNGEAVPESGTRTNTPNAVRASDQTRVTEIRPGVQEDWTIIDTGTVRGAVRQQEVERDMIAISLARLERNVPADLSVVRARLDDATRTATLLRGNEGVAQDTLNVIQAGVAQGVNSQLEFLDAQSGVLATRTALLGANLELSLAHAEFDRIVGNYLQYVQTEPPSTHPTKHSSPTKK